jgi:CRISPR/Cas system-associated endonuclease Cas3-HD
MVQEITEKKILESLDITHANEEAYLHELVAYWLHFEGYKYDRLINKLIEIPINIFQKSSPMQSIIVATSS